MLEDKTPLTLAEHPPPLPLHGGPVVVFNWWKGADKWCNNGQAAVSYCEPVKCTYMLGVSDKMASEDEYQTI